MGGSGGGSSSGKIDYPEYIKVVHATMLANCAPDGTGGDSINNSMFDAMNAAYGNSPFSGASAYNPANEITLMDTAVGNFESAVSAMATLTDWQSYYDLALLSANADIVDSSATLEGVAVAIAPTTDLAAYFTASKALVDTIVLDVSSDLNTLATTMNPVTNWESYIDSVVTKIDAKFNDTFIAAEITAFNNELDAEYNSVTLPTFQRGMQDINAVISSAFTTGAALMANEITRQKARFASQLRLQYSKERYATYVSGLQQIIELVNTKVAALKASADLKLTYANLRASSIEAQVKDESQLLLGQLQALSQAANNKLQVYLGRINSTNQNVTEMSKLALSQVELYKAAAQIVTDENRIKIVAKKEQIDQDLKIVEADARWDLELFQYAGNLLAAHSGGTSQVMGNKSSPVASAIGGALSGAASGAMIGNMVAPGIGGGIGAGLGALVGLGMSLFS